MKPALFLWLAVVSPLAAIPATSTLTLVNEPGFNRITVTVAPQVVFDLSDSDTTTLTGTVDATFDIDPAAATTRELTLTNGRANGTSMSFARSFLGQGYNITVSNLSTGLYTINPPGVVTPATGQFAASQHRFEIDQGTISGTALGSPVNESFTPENPASGTGSGTGTVTLVPAGDSGIYRTFAVTVVMPVTINDSFVTGTTTVNVTASGTLKGTGTVQVPRTEYLAWTADEGIPGAPFTGDPDGDGVPHGILWALGLPASGDARPFLPQSDPLDPKGFIFSLPAGGIATPLVLEESDDLTEWNDVGEAGISTGVNPLMKGTAGIVVVSPDGSAARFLRLRATEP